MITGDDVKLWMPLAIVVVTASVGILVFSIQKSLERRAKHRLDVQERYEKYLQSIFDVIAKHDDQDRHAAFQKMQISLRLFASADVLRKAKKLEDHLTRAARVEEPNDLAASLVNAMRAHVLPQRCSKSDSISDTEMKKLNSFSVN
jgi:hypothetical protein